MRGKAAWIAAALVTTVAMAAEPAVARSAVLPVHFAAEPGASETFFKRGNLKLKGACTDTGIVEVRPFTKRKPKRAAVFAATAESDLLGLGDSPRYLGVDSFHKQTDGFQLLGASPGLASYDNAVGTIIVADRKRVLAIEWLAESGGVGYDCRFGGVATLARESSEEAFTYRAAGGSEREPVATTDGKILAECTGTAGNGDLDFFFKSSAGVSSLYLASFSDVDSDGGDEVGYHQAEAVSESTNQLDLSGVADEHASGTMVSPGSNTRSSTVWVAARDALRSDCVFAGIKTSASAGDPDRIVYAEFAATGPPEVALDRGGLILEAECQASDLTLTARSHNSLNPTHWSIVSDADLNGTDLDEYDEEDQLGGLDSEVLSNAGDENAIGRLVYHDGADQRYVIANFAADEGGLSGGADCAVAGVAAGALIGGA